MKMLSRECGIFETPPDFVVDAPMRNGAAFLPCLLCCLSVAAADLDARRDAVMAELEALQPLLASPQTCQRIGFHGLAAEPAWIVIDHGGRVTPDRMALLPARLRGVGAEQSDFPVTLPSRFLRHEFAGQVDPGPGLRKRAPRGRDVGRVRLLLRSLLCLLAPPHAGPGCDLIAT